MVTFLLSILILLTMQSYKYLEIKVTSSCMEAAYYSMY